MNVHELPTPALVVDREAFAHNVTTMGAAWPGRSLRPHVKAWKSTGLAAALAAHGHTAFCCATPREVEGMAAAGLGDDLLLANEVLRPGADRIGAVDARVTVAIDSDDTIAAAVAGGVREVLVDVDVGMFRCGCAPGDAGRLADEARRHGLAVRGVMGYEGHLMMADAATKADQVEAAMALLREAHDRVGGDIVSGGGTGTYAVNRWVTELQAGSFALMDSDYAKLASPFRQAVFVWATVISVNTGGWAVLDAGLKAIAVDHGPPTIERARVWYVSDEHITWSPTKGDPLARVGARVRVVPGHLDPTVAKHERMYVVDRDEVVDAWEVNLRGW